MYEFSNSWETQKKDGLISKQEFFDYYTEVGASISKDEDFEERLRCMWC
jgi:hypothetical protein